MSNASLDDLLGRMGATPHITVLTGAGVSAASGVPTFRGDGSLWKNYRAEDLATPSAFARDPRLVWEWYDWRRQVVAMCQPNRAHDVIARWSHRYGDFHLVTQNVDGLHERVDTWGVLRFHGSVWEVSCWRGCDDAPTRWWDDTAPFPSLPPHCPHCGGILRPGVVWFGESIDPLVLEESVAAARCDVFFVIGTSAVVHPAASLVEIARDHGAFTVEVNTEPTPVSGMVDLVLQGAAEDVLDLIEQRLG